jgi:hypothetical protein
LFSGVEIEAPIIIRIATAAAAAAAMVRWMWKNCIEKKGETS